MTSGHKIALSLLITVLIFTLLCVFAFAGGFTFIEMHYYEPRMVKNISQTLDSISADFDSYVSTVRHSFSEYVSDPRTKTYFERESSSSDMYDRQMLTAELMEKNPGLEGIRVVESQGLHTHFSTYSSDLMMQTEDYISYLDYSDTIPFSSLAASDSDTFAGTADELDEACSLYFDDARDRFIFSYPYYDTYTAYRGTIIFYVYAQDFTRQIINSNLIALNTRSKIIAPQESRGTRQSQQNRGIVFGFPSVGRELLDTKIQDNWSKGLYGVEQLAQDQDGNMMLLVTATGSQNARIGWICSDQEFTFSQMEKLLLLICLFITFFLIIFMLFNLKHDDNVIIRERIHKFETALFREYLERKDSEDWSTLQKNAALRKQDVNAEIIKSLGATGRKHSTEISRALDQSWTEFMHIISGPYRESLEQLSAQTAKKHSSPADTRVEIMDTPAAPALYTEPSAHAEPVEEVEELEEIPEAEPVEELEEIPEAEEVEELEEIPEAEQVEELEEIPEAEEVEELEEIPAADREETDEDLGIPDIPSFVDPLDGTEDEEDLEELPATKEDILARLDEQDFESPSFLELDKEDLKKWKDENPKAGE